jgi:beta-phosphoglucomutase
MQLCLSDYDGVAFDFDGTLADSHHHHEQTRFDSFTANGFGDITMAEHRKGYMYGSTTAEIVAGVLKAGGKLPADADPYTHPIVQKLIKDKHELYKKVASLGFDEKPGAAALVRTVAKYYADKLAIVTTALYSEVVPFLKKYNLEDLFAHDRVITHETVEALGLKPKTAPDAYLLAMERLGITNPKRLLVIEDAVTGVESAKRAEATVLALGTSLGREDFYAETVTFHPDYFVPDFASIELMYPTNV